METDVKRIDMHISQIMEKMDKLAGKNPKFVCGKFPPEWGKPLELAEVERFEAEKGIRFPEDYRRFITTIAAEGSQPFYGLMHPLKKNREVEADIQEKFLYTLKAPLNIYDLSAEEHDQLFGGNVSKVDAGFVTLSHEGCGMYSILVVNTDDPDTYGTVWYYDLTNDAGIFPLVNPKDQEPMRFLDWLEFYVDETLELGDEEFCSYGELAGKF